GPPPTVEGILGHCLVLFGTTAEREDYFISLTLMKAFFFTNPNHRSGIRAKRSIAQRNLIDNCGSIHQPTDSANVGPRNSRIVEDRGIFGSSTMKLVVHFLSGNSQGFTSGIEI